MKAKKYSNSFSMFEQKRTFLGIDTYSVTHFGDFSFCSKLLHDAETRSLKNRPGMNILLSQLAKDNVILSHVAEELHQSVLSDESNLKYDVYREEATFVPVRAAVSMLKENCDVSIEVRFESEHSEKIKRSWPAEIYPIQKCNPYGADMHVVSKYQWLSAIDSEASML
eukprot:13844641-Ditylum_brightwellii.AAC.1